MTLALPLLVLAMIAFAATRFVPRVALWRAGRAAPVDWAGGLAAVPRRYLVDVHHVVERDPYAARMHAAVAGGLIGATALALIGLVPPLGASRLFWGLVAILFLAMLGGALAVGARRVPQRPKRLSGGAFQMLAVLLLAYAFGGALAAGSLALALPSAVFVVGLILAAFGGLGLAWQTGKGPMRHALTGALHLAAHPRPGRFEGQRETALRPLDLDAPKLGVEAPADFSWNRLLGFDACIQCGRCEAACPAFAAGQPLNPKRLIQDLAASMTPGGNPSYAGSDYPQARLVAGVSGFGQAIIGAAAMVHPDTLWSCTTCRACVEECPMMIEHVDAIVDLRRFQTLELGAVPEKAELVLADIRGADEPGGAPLGARADFAGGLDVPVMARKGEAEVLLWLGTNAFDMRTGRTLRALVQLLQAAKVDFAVLGEEERDCGDLARRLGDEASFQRLARLNVETLRRYRFQRIVTADPHSLHVLRNEYPAFGGAFNVVHHTAYLDELAEAGRLALRALGPTPVTYHDPCYLGRYNGEFDAPRRLLDRLGLERREMERSRKRSMCCGGGGGAPVTDIAGEQRIPDLRMAQAKDTKAELVAVACPQCTSMLEGVVGDRPDVFDVAELVLRALDTAPADAVKPARIGEPA
ncbi:(Fe-S)-binding protein [Aureimonas ureilytica]|uniref:(Fe-S)-binding protein n=1 Tax=Aureimonas ureilytica TaxID=401562 RepID=UPI003CF59581